MLLALCHRCWTWMEPKHERCVECGAAFSVRQPDPDAAALRTLFGESLVVLGEASIKRPRLPSFGVLSAFEHGLLFLPDVRELPSGGIVAVEPDTSAVGSHHSGFWNLFSRRTPSALGTLPVVRPKLSTESAVNRFLDSPGALFVSRETIVRISQRGVVFRIERKPGRTVVWRLESPLAVVQEALLRWKAHPEWSQISHSG
jgi:hypothetical protein